MAPTRHRHDPSKTLVGFVVGDVQYAVPIADVREICRPKPLVVLPHAPHAVHGVTDFRGDVIPVVDLRSHFGLPTAPASKRIKWIVVNVDERCIALIVDETLGVFGTAGAELRPAPPLGRSDQARGIEGVATHAGKMIFVLDLEAFSGVASHLALDGAEAPPADLPGGADAPLRAR